MRLKSAEKFMALAIELAKRGAGKTGPNPAVGCVIVKDRKVISTGFHKKFGAPHAEVIALRAAGKKAKGSVVFVTLEPCSYYGKTPPCTDTIIKAGVKELFCAGPDPNPLNNGRGIEALKADGIKVKCGILRSQAESINPDFIKRMKSKRPFVTLKLAQSIDGKIATRKNDSMWISSKASREFVQDLRKGHDAIMVGINTVLCDDPLLTIRGSTGRLNAKRYKKRQPLKIVIDSHLRIPLNAKLLGRCSPGKTIIAFACKASAEKEEALRNKGADIIRAGSGFKHVDLKALMKKLVQKGICSVLIEGGGEIAASMLKLGLVDKVCFFICPIIIGGKESVNAIGGQGAGTIKEALKLSNIRFKRMDNDIMVNADVYRNN
jgi:diaminohydroxyphosphoribosylaminopyrimidine deaminase / 5-amino-6-(5-phosphoribosylamino)uracil reductase